MTTLDPNKKVTCTDKDGNAFEVSVSDLKMRPSIYGVCIKDDQILLSKQWDGYDFPGGGIDLGETNEEALVREISEETGMMATVRELVACENSFFKTEKGHYLQSILIYHRCDVIGGELSNGGMAEDEKVYLGMPEWVPLANIEKIKFYNSVDSREIIRKALALREVSL